MNELARIAYEYENWQKGYLHESGESISIVQAQILKDVWISITQAELSHKTDSRDYKRDRSKGVELFTALLLQSLEANQTSNSKELAEQVIKFIDHLMREKLDKRFQFNKFINELNKNLKQDKTTAELIISIIVNNAKGDHKLTAVNVTNTTDLTFVHECMKLSSIASYSSAKTSNKVRDLTTDELVFETQIRQLIFSFLDTLNFSKVVLLPKALLFYHHRDLTSQQRNKIEGWLSSSECQILKQVSYADLLNLTSVINLKDKINQLLNDGNSQNKPYTEILNAYLTCLPAQIVNSQSFTANKTQFEAEFTQLINVQLYSVLTLNPNIIVNVDLIARRALYLSSLINLLEYTQVKSGFDYIFNKIEHNFNSFKAGTFKVAKVWILYLLERNEYTYNGFALEDWLEARFRYFVQKNQLIFKLSELKSNKGQFKNLSEDNIHSKRIQDSLSGKINEDFVNWVESHGGDDIFDNRNIEAITQQLASQLNLSNVDKLSLEQAVTHDDSYFEYWWNSVFQGQDKNIFVTETIIDAFQTFAKTDKSEDGFKMQRARWNRIVSQVGGASPKVYKRFNTVFCNSIDPLEKHKVVTSRNNSLALINMDKRLNGRYKVINKLGSGGNGYVVKAADNNLYREVAIKLNATSEFTHPEVFKREARILATLKHENIIQVYDFISVEKSIFSRHINADVYGLVTEYHFGAMTLDKYLANNILSNDQKITLFQQICNGVAAAHANNLIHGDLKPENIIVTNEGVAKLIDFGSASYEHLSKASSGSLEWLNPDVLIGKPLQKSSDIYALTLLLLFILEIDFTGVAEADEIIDPFLFGSNEQQQNESTADEIESIITQKAEQHNANHGTLFKLILASHYLLEQGWHFSDAEWQKYNLDNGKSEEAEKEYFMISGIGSKANQFLNALHANVYKGFASEQRVKSLIETLLKGLLTSALNQELSYQVQQQSCKKSKGVKSNSNYLDHALIKLAEQSNNKPLETIETVEQLSAASYVLLDASASHVNNEVVLKPQLFINGRLLTKPYLQSIPEVYSVDDPRIQKVICKFNSVGMDYLFTDVIVQLHDGSPARLCIYNDGVYIDKHSHRLLDAIEHAKTIDLVA